MGEVWGNQVQASMVLSQRSHRTHRIPPARSRDSLCEGLLQAEHPGVFWGALHIGGLCLVYKKVLDFQKKSRYLA